MQAKLLHIIAKLFLKRLITIRIGIDISLSVISINRGNKQMTMLEFMLQSTLSLIREHLLLSDIFEEVKMIF